MDQLSPLFARSGLSLDRLRTLCQLAEAGSLTAAAGGDLTKVSLYSRQVKELEGYFGARLVRRAGRQLALTERGRELARLARRQLVELSDFARHCRRAPLTLSLGAGASTAEWLVVRRLRDLRQALGQPALSLVRASSERLAERLRDLQLDLALLRQEALAPPLESRPFLSYGFTIFVPTGLAGPPAQWRRWLPAVPMVVPAEGWTRRALDAACARAGLSLRLAVEGFSATLALRAIQDGAHAAILPEIADAEIPAETAVRLRPPFLRQIERRLVIAWHPRMADARPVILEAAQTIATW